MYKKGFSPYCFNEYLFHRIWRNRVGCLLVFVASYHVVLLSQYSVHGPGALTENKQSRHRQMSIQRLPRAVSATIVSTSSVQSQVSVLKELIENAIDAIGSKNQGQIYVEIDKESAGLDFLSVKDNGSGIEKADRNVMCMNCTTSKMTSMDQLSAGVFTCGFRGEALNFIAHLASTMQISTKTNSDVTMETWSVKNSGLPKAGSKMSPGSVGTTVKVIGLFKETPVRYKYLKEKKAKLLKNMEHLITEFALIYRDIRFQLRYVKLLPNGRLANGDCKSYPHKIPPIQALQDMLEIRKRGWLFEKKFDFNVKDGLSNSFAVNVTVVLPKMRAQDIPSTKNSFKLLSVNYRPLDLSLKLGKLVSVKINESYSENMLLAPTVWFVSISIPLDKVDVNIEPEKCDMIVCNEEHFIEEFKQHLSQVIADEHATKVETVINSNADERLVNFQIPPLLTKRKANHLFSETCSINSQLKENTATDNNTSVQSPNEIENLLGPNDESFVQELDSTSRQVKNPYCDGNNNVPIHSINVDPTNEALFVPQADETVDLDNEWSSTICDTTRFSSEMDIADDIVTVHEKCADTINPYILLVSEPVNPETESDHVSYKFDTAAEGSVSNTSTDASLSANKKPIATISDGKIKNVTVDQSNATKQKFLKQMPVSSYLTYHLSPSKKRVLVDPRQKVFRIGDLSQDTFGEKMDVAFQLTLDMKRRHRFLVNDERWVKRSGIPSTDLALGAVELYERISHRPTDKLPKLDESGIYQML